MNRLCWFVGTFAAVLAAGCNTDIVATKQLRAIKHKCVYLAPLESEDPQVGKVVRDVIEKELIRGKIDLCDADSANVLFTGATFLTARTRSNEGLFGASSDSGQAIESVSLIAKDREGQVLLSASYDNKEGSTASKLGKEFGAAIAAKLR